MEIAIPVVVLLVIILLVVLGFVMTATRQSRRAEVLKTGSAESLRYLVPPGQDPAAVIAALQAEDYDAAPDNATGSQPVVVIQCPNGLATDRPRVRAILEQQLPLNMEGDRDPGLLPVRFADE